MKTILFVDDENLILSALKKVFDDDQYKYVYLNDGHDALDYMAQNHVDLLCSDIMMPNMGGADLLRRVKEKYPKIIRMALTSLGHTQHVKKLTLENLAQLFMFKPWDDTELKMNIYKVLNMQSALYSAEMMNMLQGLESLPTLPDIYDRLSLMMKEDYPIDDIAGLIEKDQSITSVILRVANSAFYGRKTGNINQAIMNIGLNNLKSIVLANTVFQDLAEDTGMLLEMWRHAANSNKLVTAIYSELLGKPLPSLFGCVGLLHDIGKVVLYHNYDEYRSLLKVSSDEVRSLLELEHDEFGVTHQDLGAYLLNLWDLPFAYVEVALYHHRPMDHRIINKELVGVSHLAHYYSCKEIENDKSNVLDEKVFPLLKIEKEDLESMIVNELGWRIYD